MIQYSLEVLEPHSRVRTLVSVSSVKWTRQALLSIFSSVASESSASSVESSSESASLSSEDADKSDVRRRELSASQYVSS